jgi:hypothetical protein
LYLRTATYGFVLHDDPWLIRDNRLLHELSTASVWRVLSDFSPEQRYRLGAEYLPVRDLSVMLDYAVYGDWVGGHHVTQVLLYAGVCAVLPSLVLALFESRPLAWLTGLLFATHPVQGGQRLTVEAPIGSPPVYARDQDRDDLRNWQTLTYADCR